MSLESDGWISTRTGGWCRPGESVVIFRRRNIAGGWGVCCDGAFSRGAYETAEQAAAAYDANQIRWTYPEAWKRKKDGSGWYRQTQRRGVISVKQAKSGSWYWTGMTEGGPHGWFATAEQAKVAADNGTSAAQETAPDEDVDAKLDAILAEFD